MMLSMSVCPGTCESCYLKGTTATCLTSGCKQGYAAKSDGACAGEYVPVCNFETY